MDKKKLENIVKQIKALEEECQAGKDVEVNMNKMNTILDSLTIEEMFEVALALEDIFPNIDV